MNLTVFVPLIFGLVSGIIYFKFFEKKFNQVFEQQLKQGSIFLNSSLIRLWILIPTILFIVNFFKLNYYYFSSAFIIATIIMLFNKFLRPNESFFN